MSSARQGLSLIGQAVGAYFGGPIGSAVGGIIGGEIGGLIDGPPEGPRLDDLSAPQIQYGGKIPRFYGGPRWFEIGTLWASEKREDSETVGGKGGDSGVEQFSYRADFLLRVCESRQGTPCEVIAVTGVEVDGQLKWTALADSGSESIENSAEQGDWSDMAVMLGREDQAPWSVMEAAVGASNAIAYRGYLTVGFSDLLLGPNGEPRRIRIQAITVGERTESDVFLLLNFENGAGLTFVDESTRNYAVDDPASEVIDSGARFGTGCATNTPTVNNTSGFEVDINEPWTPDESFTLERRIYIDHDLDQPLIFAGVGNGGSDIYFGLRDDVSPNIKALRLVVFDQVLDGDAMVPPDYPVPTGGWNDIVLDWDGDTHTARGIVNGTVVIQYTYIGTPPALTALGKSWAMFVSSGTQSAGAWRLDGWRDTLRRRYTSDLEMPNEAPTDDGAGPWEVGTVDLRSILEYEASRCVPLAAQNIDFSAAAGIPVDLHVAIGTAAEAMQPLLTRFWFDLYSADRLYLVRRGGGVEQTIPFRLTGANSEGFSGLIRNNDVEIAKKKAITYANILMDGESDTRTGDRESPGSDVDTLSMNLNMRPSEAQGLADTATADGRVAGHTATIRVGARQGLLLQPGSVIEVIDHHGNTYRALVRRITWDRWVWTCDIRLDDPAVLQSAGIAVDLDQRSLTVADPPLATLYVLDIPLLRMQDDSPGEYAAVTQTGRFRGVDIFKSSDDVTYNRIASIDQRATAGQCDSALPSFGGWGWDNSSVLVVTLDDGSGSTLSSATKSAIEANRSLNLAAVGEHGRWELLQFASATLLTGSTYELRGLLRNLLGTEWASSLHETADSFVLINAALGILPGAVSDMGQTRYYKAVPAGRSRDSVSAIAIECEEQRLLPYAVTDVWNDAGTVRWNRRSRMEGAIGLDPPLGEVSERYDAELYDGVTLEDSESGLTSPEWTPVDPSGLTVLVYQLSDLVGRGHEAEAVLT